MPSGRDIATKIPLFVLLFLSPLFVQQTGDFPSVFVTDQPIHAIRRTTFVAVGDIMLSRGVNRAIDRAGDPSYPFLRMKQVLESADFCFGNLESPISGNDRLGGKGLVFNTHANDIEGLGRFGFKVVSIANNHALDQRRNGLANTIAELDRAAIAHPGAGADLSEAWRPAIIDSNGIRIAFIAASYSSFNDGGATRNEFVARIEDEARLAASIHSARSESDLVIVTMHAGIEYRRRPERGQIAFARQAIDLGADAVIGGHPHWIQTIERYRGKFIFYSLGNFIFDQRTIDTKEGLLLKIMVVKAARATIESVELVPVISDKLASPRPASETETHAILKKIGITSSILRP